jgi:hypothetical protein
MKKLALIMTVLLAVLLGSCMTMGGRTDFYQLERQEYVKQEVAVSFVDYPNQKEFDQALKKYDVQENPSRKVMSFAVLKPKENKCEIHTIDQRVKYMPEWLGHELAHCRYGRFHK